MSHRVFHAGKLLLFAFFAFSLTAITLQAQDDAAPKYDLFVGYQWLHPGATVPNPFSTAANATALQLPDMAKGFGASFTYNFSRYVGFEGDFGHNWDNYETTGSAGPRFLFRTGDGSYFLHALVSYNRLGVNGFQAGNNGIGGIFGGGTDYKINRRVSWRIFEADYVTAQHHYSQF